MSYTTHAPRTLRTLSRALTRSLRRGQGVTLVELMIVVAIVGILAAVGGVALFRYTKQAKITKLESYAMAAAAGQNEFYNRHNVYYPLTGTQSAPLAGTQDPTDKTTEYGRWATFLGFGTAAPC